MPDPNNVIANVQVNIIPYGTLLISETYNYQPHKDQKQEIVYPMTGVLDGSIIYESIPVINLQQP